MRMKLNEVVGAKGMKVVKIMEKVLIALVVVGLAPAQATAADANSALFRGHVLQVRNHYTSGGLFRVEVQLFTQAPSGGPYSPRFFCSPLIWDDCEVSDLITGCTPICETEPGADDSKVEVCHCTPFNPGAGICLETAPFHDGFGMLAESVASSSGCSSL